MASINYAAREISVKIVYYGPGLSGKTTNLQIIHRKVPKEFKSDMVSLATETDRTLFFDFLPLNLGKIKGFTAKFQLYTVPGQVYYSVTRKLVLRGVDGIVFVADSQSEKMAENLESFQNMEENLTEYGYKHEEIPIVLQYNKRDLPTALPVEELQSKLNKFNSAYTEAIASKGVGVFESLKLIGKIVIDELNRKYSKPSLAPAAPKPAPAPAPAPRQVAPPPPPPQHQRGPAPSPFAVQPKPMPAPSFPQQPQTFQQSYNTAGFGAQQQAQSLERQTPTFNAPPRQPAFEQAHQPLPGSGKSALDLEIERYQNQMTQTSQQAPSQFAGFQNAQGVGQNQQPPYPPAAPSYGFGPAAAQPQNAPAGAPFAPAYGAAPQYDSAPAPQDSNSQAEIGRPTPSFQSPFQTRQAGTNSDGSYYVSKEKRAPRRTLDEGSGDLPKKKGFLGKIFGRNS